MVTVNNKDTRSIPMTSVTFHCSGISIVNFEQVNLGDTSKSIIFQHFDLFSSGRKHFINSLEITINAKLKLGVA